MTHDCREGICGTCSLIDQRHAARPERDHDLPALHADFKDGDDDLRRAVPREGFPVIKDLVVDRTAFDRIMQAGGFITARTGGAPDGERHPRPEDDADRAMDAAACIGCGACVAACPNGSAMLFVGGEDVAPRPAAAGPAASACARVLRMVAQMDAEGFGNCTNHYECEAVCPKEMGLPFIAMLNKDFWKAAFRD